MFPIMEAIQSTALSHEEMCECTVCRAAGGDKSALAQVIAATWSRTPTEGPSDG